MNRKRLIRLLIGFGVSLVLLAAGFAAWALTGPGPEPAALAALVSDAAVRVETQPWLTFTPQTTSPQVGLVLYPGARVDARAYAPVARDIAAQGYLVVIVPMPLRFAVFDPNAAADVLAAHPDLDAWAVGGHSLGGVMAANFAYNHPAEVSGLVLWAAYPAAGDDLHQRDLAVVSLYGEADGLAQPADVLAAAPLLPSATTWVPLPGGNHAQFGRYGPQAGDNPATLTPEAQQAQVAAATAALLAQVE